MYGKTSMSEQFLKATGNWSDRIKRNGSGFVGAGVEINDDWSSAELELEKRKLLVAKDQVTSRLNTVKDWMKEAVAYHQRTGRWADKAEWVKADADRRDLGRKVQSMQATLAEINRRLRQQNAVEFDQKLVQCLGEVVTARLGQEQWERFWKEALDLARVKERNLAT